VLPDRAGRPAVTALFIGKDFYRKGGDLVLRAFSQVRAQLPAARLLFLTDGPIPAGLALDGVEVIRPTWDRAVIAGLYRQADVFVLPSRLETWGDVFLEAMAFGLPCLGVAGQSMDDFIEPGETGCLVPPGDVQSLAAALAHLMADEPLRRRWGEAARKTAEERFTWDSVAGRILAVTETVIKP
jgi:glycosyltransferase involved in cell wall biosynthesis